MIERGKVETFPALELISIITWSVQCPRPPTVAAAKKVGFAAARDGHFIFRFVVPKIHGNSSIYSKKCFLTLIFVFYLQIFDISFALQRKSRLSLER